MATRIGSWDRFKKWTRLSDYFEEWSSFENFPWSNFPNSLHNPDHIEKTHFKRNRKHNQRTRVFYRQTRRKLHNYRNASIFVFWCNIDYFSIDRPNNEQKYDYGYGFVWLSGYEQKFECYQWADRIPATMDIFSYAISSPLIDLTHS